MAKKPQSKKPARPQFRFGISEWYGLPFDGLSKDELRRFATLQLLEDETRPAVRCPFLSSNTEDVPCWKKQGGGVCGIRRYEINPETGAVKHESADPAPRTTCPSRFEEGGVIYPWVGEVILGSKEVVPIGQVGFLDPVPLMKEEGEEATKKKDVGRIDNILVVPGSVPLRWCPMEIQAVYFSGEGMESDWKAIQGWATVDTPGTSLPFPTKNRRPDYRSSATKRLLPQLQTKVPTLSRWGKKTAVVVDEEFFQAMGRIETVRDLSNADIVWFVANFDVTEIRPRLAPHRHYFTTLQSSLESLTAGRPVSQSVFEQRIRENLSKLRAGPREVPSDE
jgi:hypothetical protein